MSATRNSRTQCRAVAPYKIPAHRNGPRDPLEALVQRDPLASRYLDEHRGPMGFAFSRGEDNFSFHLSKRLAKRIDKTAHLDYIPMCERWGCEWEKDGRLWDPKRGRLTVVTRTKGPLLSPPAFCLGAPSSCLRAFAYELYCALLRITKDLLRIAAHY